MGPILSGVKHMGFTRICRRSIPGPRTRAGSPGFLHPRMRRTA
uniref:Uncharacterized protein n=1 Tax=Arundo donax TaxID=35708 RepID=A0A0A8ZYN2_ARUDO